VSWRPKGTVESARARASALACAREFFSDRQVLEVETPILTRHATMDANIESVVANLSARDVFLHTSPEYHMKRLLAAGYPDIFQICRVFRGGEVGRYHLPEFSMVEWYRLGFDLQAIIRDSVEFINAILGDRLVTTESIALSYQQAFEKAVDLNPFDAGIAELIKTVGADDDLVGSLGEDRDAWLDLAMASLVAPTFEAQQLTVVYHYPMTQASLARACPENSQLADRFEIYLGELELANGFVELTDATVQLQRFERDQHLRRENDRTIHEIDSTLIDALREGLPQCAGVAIGLDRLLMLKLNANHINAVTTFVPGN
jgi:elongation factor P--(R)-beta-lysine ligase